MRQLLADVPGDPLLELAALEPLDADQYLAPAARRLRRGALHVVPQMDLCAQLAIVTSPSPISSSNTWDQQWRARAYIYPEVVAEGDVVERDDVVYGPPAAVLRRELELGADHLAAEDGHVAVELVADVPLQDARPDGLPRGGGVVEAPDPAHRPRLQGSPVEHTHEQISLRQPKVEVFGSTHIHSRMLTTE